MHNSCRIKNIIQNYGSILLCGAGQIGSRHLQGLKKCKLPLRIFIYEINEKSMAKARNCWQKTYRKNQPHELSFHTAICSLPQDVDIAIVATTADVRASLVAKIGNYTNVKYWILEKVLTQKEEDIDLILSIIRTNSNAWVNIPRRTMPWYLEIKSRMGLKRPLTLKIEGGTWGLACNSVHFLDLLAWWTGKRYRVLTPHNLIQSGLKVNDRAFGRSMVRLKRTFREDRKRF